MTVYLDHNATTPTRPEVIEAMCQCLRAGHGNPSSIHFAGRRALEAMERARESVAELIGARPDEIIFTSGGTEADNLALLGSVDSGAAGGRVLISAIEHHAVLQAAQELGRRGVEVLKAGADGSGVVAVAELEALCTSDTDLVSVMLVNNDVGSVQPIAQIARLCHDRGVRLHSDAVQAAGKLRIDVAALGVDLLSLSAHKLGGPTGVGALYLKRGLRLRPMLFGGEHERRRRAGTENLAGIVGFARACELAQAELDDHAARMSRLRARLLDGIRSALTEVVVNTPLENSVPSTLNLSFTGVQAEALLIQLDLAGLAASTGSACSSGSFAASHVLEAMGRSPQQARSAVRLSLGWNQTEDEIEAAIDLIVASVQALRGARR